MRDLRVGPNSTLIRLESDREALPFPAGGVFGDEPDLAHQETVRELERTLSTMQRQLDELGEAVDDVLRFTDYTGDDRAEAPMPAA